MWLDSCVNITSSFLDTFFYRWHVHMYLCSSEVWPIQCGTFYLLIIVNCLSSWSHCSGGHCVLAHLCVYVSLCGVSKPLDFSISSVVQKKILVPLLFFFKSRLRISCAKVTFYKRKSHLSVVVFCNLPNNFVLNIGKWAQLLLIRENI